MFCRMMKIQCTCQEYILMCKVQIGSEILKKVICAFKMITSVHQRKVLWKGIFCYDAYDAMLNNE